MSPEITSSAASYGSGPLSLLMLESLVYNKDHPLTDENELY